MPKSVAIETIIMGVANLNSVAPSSKVEHKITVENFQIHDY